MLSEPIKSNGQASLRSKSEKRDADSESVSSTQTSMRVTKRNGET